MALHDGLCCERCSPSGHDECRGKGLQVRAPNGVRLAGTEFSLILYALYPNLRSRII